MKNYRGTAVSGNSFAPTASSLIFILSFPNIFSSFPKFRISFSKFHRPILPSSLSLFVQSRSCFRQRLCRDRFYSSPLRIEAEADAEEGARVGAKDPYLNQYPYPALLLVRRRFWLGSKGLAVGSK